MASSDSECVPPVVSTAIPGVHHAADDADRRLLQAASTGDAGVTRELIASGLLDPCKCVYTHGDHTSPLRAACIRGHTEVFEAILSSAPRDLSQRDHSGRTVLHRAAAAGHAHIVSLLITAGASLVEWDSNHWSPLHFAAAGGHVTVITQLLRAGASPNVRYITPVGFKYKKKPDYDEFSPLHCATDRLQAAAAVLLIAAGADETALDAQGFTPRGRIAALAAVVAPEVAAAMRSFLASLPPPEDPAVAYPDRPWSCIRYCSSFGFAHTPTCPCRLTRPPQQCLLCRCTEACRTAAGEQCQWQGSSNG